MADIQKNLPATFENANASHAVDIVKRECLLCDRSLKVIGRQRVNGQTTFDDWTERLFHKRCDRKVQICLIHTPNYIELLKKSKKNK